MRTDLTVLNALLVIGFDWGVNWAWGLPLIVLTVIMHAVGLAIIGQTALNLCYRPVARLHPKLTFVMATAGTTLFATCLHGIEAAVWASAYCVPRILPDFGSSMLYSLNAMTTFGHTTVEVGGSWRLLGSLEALNGWLLFGLTTAFLFAVMQKLWLDRK